MKLWLLRPVEDCPLWKPRYDKVFGFVVRADGASVRDSRGKELMLAVYAGVEW